MTIDGSSSAFTSSDLMLAIAVADVVEPPDVAGLNLVEDCRISVDGYCRCFQQDGACIGVFLYARLRIKWAFLMYCVDQMRWGDPHVSDPVATVGAGLARMGRYFYRSASR